MIARDIPSTVQIVFKNATSPYAEAVRRSGILDTIDPDKNSYIYLIPEDVGMSAEKFLTRKDLLKVIKYHILVGAVDDQPGEYTYDRLALGKPVRERTLLGPIVTFTQRGRPCMRRTFVNGIELDGSPADVNLGNGILLNAETLIPFPKNTSE